MLTELTETHQRRSKGKTVKKKEARKKRSEREEEANERYRD